MYNHLIDFIDDNNILSKHQFRFRKYGIHSNVLEWFISYLDNRKQYLFYNGSKSNDQYIPCGVPQGSILGPLLLILYINDLSNISES